MKGKNTLLSILLISLIALPAFAKKNTKPKRSLRIHGGIQFFTDYYKFNDTNNYGTSLRNVLFGVKGKIKNRITFMVRIKSDYSYGTGITLKPSRTWFDIELFPPLHLRLGKEFAPTSRFALYDQYSMISAQRVGYYTYIGPLYGLYTFYALGTIYPDQGIYFWGKFSPLQTFHIKYYASFLNGFYAGTEPISKKGRFVGRLQINIGRPESDYSQKGFYFGKNTFSLGYSYDRDLNFYDTDGDKIVDNPSQNHTFDLFIERVQGPVVINIEGSYIIWNDLNEKLLNDYKAKFGRVAIYLPKIHLQPYFSYEDYKFDRDYIYKFRILKFGLNYYLQRDLSFRLGYAYFKRTIKEAKVRYHNIFLGVFFKF